MWCAGLDHAFVSCASTAWLHGGCLPSHIFTLLFVFAQVSHTALSRLTDLGLSVTVYSSTKVIMFDTQEDKATALQLLDFIDFHAVLFYSFIYLFIIYFLICKQIF